MSGDADKLEGIFKLVSEMDEIGPSNDELARLVLKEKFMADKELTAEDLDLVAAAQSNPNYTKFMKFVLEKDKK